MQHATKTAYEQINIIMLSYCKVYGVSGMCQTQKQNKINKGSIKKTFVYINLQARPMRNDNMSTVM